MHPICGDALFLFVSYSYSNYRGTGPGTALVPGYTPVYVYELVPDIHTILVGPFHRVRYNIDIDTMFSPNPVPLGFMYLGFMYAAMPGWAPHTLLTPRHKCTGSAAMMIRPYL
jgi:hypothetical protein